MKAITTKESYKEHLILAKYFKKASFIGRKIMLNINKAKERIEQLLQFFLVVIHLFEETKEAKDNEFTREVAGPMLELVYRTYTDE